MATDAYYTWSSQAKAMRSLLEPHFCRHSAKPYPSHQKKCRVGFGWPMGETKHYILALAEDQADHRRLLVRLSVGEGHGLIYTGSTFFMPNTKNDPDESDRVDCYIPYGGPLPKGFSDAVESAFENMLRDSKLAKYRQSKLKLTEMPKALDIGEPPPRVKYEISRIVRDTATACDVKTACKHGCQLCGQTLLLCGVPYSEAHHLHPVGTPYCGFDVRDNLIVVCPNCHVKLDYGSIRIDISKLHFRNLHCPSEKFVSYHNETIVQKK